ncbi:polysaccharide biosynthesis tyrosine autokinase [Nocardioides pantholopis]|uniref:polysaccharide biosynthesis tyrosine autokinase n=1 Tax=Nocardioides pantholopis TaxID=2483798 RepID=UPI000F08D92A|nr:polysaccharide biosynthesis tyrosine autokinase [Nocardioides pantholopis]
MELRDYIRILRRRWVSILLVAVVGTALAAAATAAQTPQYASSARLFVSTSEGDQSAVFQGGQFSAQRVKSYADLITSRELATRVVDDLDLEAEAGELVGQVSASVVVDTVNLSLEVRDSDAARAQRIAQAYAEQLVEMVRELETPPGGTQAPVKATIVDAASFSDAPVSPSWPRNLGLGLVLGLLLGVGLAVLRDLLDMTIKGPDDTAQATDAAVLGAITYDPATKSKPLVTSLAPHAPRVEAFRVLRTNMQFVDVDGQDKVFVITSSLPGEGKTTTSLNLALTLAQAGKRTLLIEADLRRPKASAELGLDNAVGVTTVLVGKVSLDEAIQKHAETDLHLLASGAVPPNPAELLQSKAMADLLVEVRERYDIVIIDAPPLLPVTDAALLATHADGALVIARHGKTTKEQFAQAIQRLEQVGARPVGVVLNMVPTGRGAGGYGYGYGYGYAPDNASA